MANHARCSLNAAALVPYDRRLVPANVVQKQPNGDLHDMIPDDCLQTLPSCDVVSFELVFGGVDTPVAEEIVSVEKVEEGGGDGVDDCREDGCEDVVG